MLCKFTDSETAVQRTQQPEYARILPAKVQLLNFLDSQAKSAHQSIAADWVADVMPYWKPLHKVLKLSAPILKAVGKLKATILGDFISRGLGSAGELGSLSSEDAKGMLTEALVSHSQPIAVCEQARVTLRALIEDLYT